jgi:hypothetical protein
MGYMIRQITVERTLCQELTVDLLRATLTNATIETVLTGHDAHAARERKFTMTAVVWILIAMNLYATIAISAVIRTVFKSLRLLSPADDPIVPGDSAFTYRRYQLGARPLVDLFHTVCVPMTTPQTPGAFLFGLRLVALDGTVEDVPDTAANVRAFGRLHSTRGPAAFPQVQGVYLVEVGSHALIDAGFWPIHTSERVGGFRLLRSVTPEMLVMWDRGFHDYEMLCAVRRRGGHVLGRLPAHVKPQRVRPLPDGSYLAYLAPSASHRRKAGERLLVRIVEYTLTDPAFAGSGEHYRVVTTLLDPTVAPAFEVACAYHERWEIELVIDEVDSHQRLAGRPLRSQQPVGVIQELYALLIAHYAVRRVMLEAATTAELDPDRLSFTHALRVMQESLPEFQLVERAELPRLYERLVRDVARERVPEREPRRNARVVKRKMSSFKLKRAEHAHPPKPTIGSFREAVHVCCPAEDDHPDLLLDLSVSLDLTLIPRQEPVECLI